jgi:hypothetical protein
VTKHVYTGTASVGDFLNVTVDTAAKTLAYTNFTNGDNATLSYTLNPDGSYALNDPSGNMTAAYEVPGYGLLISAEKAGPSKNTPALITAVESGPISLATFANKGYNYIQFRTAAGGLEVGSVVIGAATGQDSSYWPYGNLNSMQNSPFNSGTLDFSQATEAPSGTYMYASDGANGTDYVFGTANGFFMDDSPNGSIIGLQKAATKAFDPTVAGTYGAMFYQKTGASTGPGNVETGTPLLGRATIAITASGGVTVTDSSGNVVTTAQLTPVADTNYLYGSPGELTDPCYGMFTFRTVAGGVQQDVFMSFVQNAVIFATFSAPTPWTPQSGTYNYIYGVGLK